MVGKLRILSLQTGLPFQVPAQIASFFGNRFCGCMTFLLPIHIPMYVAFVVQFLRTAFDDLSVKKKCFPTKLITIRNLMNVLLVCQMN